MPAGYTVLPLIYDRWQRTYGKDYSTLILPRLLATIEAFRIPTSSMEDTLLAGDLLLVNKAVYGAEVPGTTGGCSPQADG